MNFRRIMPLIGVALLLLGAVSADRALAQDEMLRWTWYRAPSANPIDHYVVQMWSRENFRWEYETDVAGTEFEVSAECNRIYVLRVAAVDVEGRMGPFSRPSVAYTHKCGDDDSEDLGVPGAPGTPQPTIIR